MRRTTALLMGRERVAYQKATRIKAVTLELDESDVTDSKYVDTLDLSLIRSMKKLLIREAKGVKETAEAKDVNKAQEAKEKAGRGS